MFTLALVLLAAAAQGQTQPADQVIPDLADRIVQCSVDDGAILMAPLAEHPGGLVPYFSHFAAYGLLRAYDETGTVEYLDTADRWIEWYGEHMRPDGTVTDYVFDEAGELVSTDDMDSTDSYAAMYLWLLEERHRVTGGDEAWLREHELQCLRAVSAIMLTLRETGLTEGKPGWPLEYLMDNAEVVVGLRAAAELFTALGNDGMASWATRAADRAEHELAGWYDVERGYYAYYRDRNGEMGYALEEWYPGGMAQVLLLARLGEPTRRHRDLLTLVMEGHPQPGGPADMVWCALAAQRVEEAVLHAELIAGLHALAGEAPDRLDSFQAGLMLEALTAASGKHLD